MGCEGFTLGFLFAVCVEIPDAYTNAVRITVTAMIVYALFGCAVDFGFRARTVVLVRFGRVGCSYSVAVVADAAERAAARLLAVV